jgi:hypothetical protein
MIAIIHLVPHRFVIIFKEDFMERVKKAFKMTDEQFNALSARQNRSSAPK